MEFWFLLAVLPIFFWGIAAVLAKVSTPKLNVVRVAILISVIEGAMYFAGYISFRTSVVLSADSILLGLASALIGMVAYLCFYESMIDGQVAVIGTISAAYPVLTVVGALLFLSENLTAYEALGLVAVIFGILGLSYERTPNSQYSIPKRSLIFALIAFLLWGVWGLTTKIALSMLGPGNVFGFYSISAVGIPLVYFTLRRNRLSTGEKPSRFIWAAGAAGVASNVLGTLIFGFALSLGQAALVVPISSAYPLVTVVLAILLLGEKLNRLQTVALTLVLLGLITIGITS